MKSKILHASNLTPSKMNMVNFEQEEFHYTSDNWTGSSTHRLSFHGTKLTLLTDTNGRFLNPKFGNKKPAFTRLQTGTSVKRLNGQEVRCREEPRDLSRPISHKRRRRRAPPSTAPPSPSPWQRPRWQLVGRVLWRRRGRARSP